MKVYRMNNSKDTKLTNQKEHLGRLDIDISHHIIKNLPVQVGSQIMVLKRKEQNSVEIPVMMIQPIQITGKLSKKKKFRLKTHKIIKK